MSRLRTSLVATAVMLGAGAVGHAVVTSPQAAGWMADLAEGAAESLLGEEVLIGSIEPALWPPQVHIEGFVVRSRSDARVIVAMESADIDIALPLRVSRIELQSPALRVRVGQDLPGLFTERGDPIDRLPFDELVVRDGRVRMEMDETQVTVEGIELGPDPIAGRSTLSMSRVAIQRGSWNQEARDVEFSGLLIGPERIEVPEIDVVFPVAHVEGELGMELGGDLRGLLSVDVEPSELPLEDYTSAAGDLSADLQLSGTTESPQLQALIVGSPAIVDDGDRYGFGQIEAQLDADRDGVRLTRFDQFIDDGHIQGDAFVDWEGRVRDATLRLEGVSLHDVLIETADYDDPYVELLIDGEIHLDGSLSPLDLDGPVSLALADFVVADDGIRGPHDDVLAIPSGSLDGRLSFDEDGVRILAERLVAGGTSGRVDAWLPFDGDMDIDAHFGRADLRTFRPLADVQLEGRGLVEARVYGPYDDPDIDGLVRVRDFRIFDFDVADTMEAPVTCHDLETVLVDLSGRADDTRLRGELLLDFREDFVMDLGLLVSSGRVEDLVRPFADLPQIEGDVSGVLTLYGDPSALDGDVDLKIGAASIYGEVFEDGRAVGRMSRGVLSIEELSVRRPDERVVITGTVGDDLVLDLHASTEGLRLERLNALDGAEGRVLGSLETDLRVLGSLPAPEPSGRVLLSDLRVHGARAPAISVDVRSDARGVSIDGGARDGSLQLEGEVDRAGVWSLLAELDDAPLHLLAPVAADGGAIDGKLSGLVVARGDGERRALSLTASKTEIAWSDRLLASPLPWTLRWGSDGLVVEDLVLAGHRTHLAAGLQLIDDQIYATVDGAWDASWILALSDDFSAAEGIGRIELVLDGPVTAPDGELSLGLHQGRLVADVLPEPLDRVELRLRGGPSLWEVQEGRGELGGGTASLAGRVLAESWVPVRYELSAEVVQARVEPLEDLPPFVGDAQLRLTGPPEELVLSGTARIDDMVFVERIDWEQWAVDFREQRLVDGDDALGRPPSFDIDVAIVADDSVRIRNNVGEGIADADLRLVGDDTRIGLVGTIRMEPGGRIFVQGREFLVARAEIRYVDPYSYDPDLDILLETEVRGRERTWRVTYPVTGPFSNWRAEPRSDPDLPSADIHALLLFGMTREELESSGGASAALAAEGIDLLVTGEGSRALDRLGSDALVDLFQYTRVDVVSGVSQRGTVGSDEWRILVERDLQEPADARVIGEFSLDDRYLAVEKALARNLYLRLFWSSLEREQSRELGGAYGADVEVRWEAD